MGPTYFVIALLGCADGAAECRTVAAPAMRYASEQACLSARGDVLAANTDLDFPTLLATCVPGLGRPAATAAPDPSRDDGQSA